MFCGVGLSLRGNGSGSLLDYKKFSDVPFTGKTAGEEQGSIKNGKKVGPWAIYWNNGQLSDKGTYKDGKKYDPWFSYWADGQLFYKGNYKNGKEDGPWVSFNKDGVKVKK